MTSTGSGSRGRHGGPRDAGSERIRRRAAGLLVAAGLVLLSACSGAPTTAGPTPPKTNEATGTGRTAGSGGGSGAAGASAGVREVDAYRFEVRSADVLAADKALLAPEAGKSVVGLDLEVTNISSQSQPVSTFAQLTLKLPDGTKAVEIPPADGVKAFKDGSLAPGSSTDGLVLYEVPNDQLSPVTLEMAGDLSGRNATLELQPKTR